MTRGHPSQIGVGYLIGILTGLAMDLKILFKHYIECENENSYLRENPVDLHEWFDVHISSCAISHVGSSCAMEQEAALKLWQISEGIMTLLPDRDAKNISVFKY
ncbi:hypothetical protein TNCV_918861 [Trichonephila clavipes]|nr:hypothetical protein TNCV_918861 [Trichonephila clavipes]